MSALLCTNGRTPQVAAHTNSDIDRRNPMMVSRSAIAYWDSSNPCSHPLAFYCSATTPLGPCPSNGAGAPF